MSKKSQPQAKTLPAAVLIIAGLIAIASAIAFIVLENGQGASYVPALTGDNGTSTDSQHAEAIASSTSGFPYIVIVGSCGPYFGGTCFNMRGGPGTEFPSLLKLRDGVVLKVADTVVNSNGETWYKIDPGANIRYPERITSDWYVSASGAELFYDSGDSGIKPSELASTTKRILVSVTKQKLYAFDGGTLFMEQPISTGLDLTPTQRGVFEVYWKTPSRYMQGPIPGVSDQVYDLPGVPWNLYFTHDGAVIHGAYWHDHFGQKWSHGCVNLPPELAKKLYEWADVGTQVIITE